MPGALIPWPVKKIILGSKRRRRLSSSDSGEEGESYGIPEILPDIDYKDIGGDDGGGGAGIV